MRINNNIMAMNTQRQLSINDNKTAKSVEKLSSGYRINRAGDDAAGLAISEKMRAQIRGLTMASKNSQDAISLVQTAEGALTETHSILQRMRELAVQSGTDTNDGNVGATTSGAVDRAALNTEFSALKEEINDIASQTAFNGKKLLDGSISGSKINTESTIFNTLGTADIGMVGDAKAGTYTALTYTQASAAGNAIGADAATYIEAADITVDNTAKAGDYSISHDGTNWHASLGGVNQEITVDGDTISFAGIHINTDDLTTPATNYTAAKTITVTAAKIDATYTPAGGGATVALTGSFDADGSVTLKDNTIPAAPVSYGIQINASAIGVGKMTTGSAVAGSLVVESTGGSLTIQTGSNANETMSISVGAMDTTSLLLANASIDTHDNASTAITSVNTAINTVSTQRAKLGAYQNRLEHKIANLDTSAENLQSAESRVRDVDMAKEMMEYTKNNILSQAATAMLAQANQAPQGVLQLLQ
ncbi:MAG: flagellin [Clostridiaceae bacterium]|nr:flagellin [Clostridiaceae bacterium]